jgi:hypothetical protein
MTCIFREKISDEIVPLRPREEPPESLTKFHVTVKHEEIIPPKPAPPPPPPNGDFMPLFHPKVIPPPSPPLDNDDYEYDSIHSILAFTSMRRMNSTRSKASLKSPREGLRKFGAENGSTEKVARE